jgi:hypothetical protein
MDKNYIKHSLERIQEWIRDSIDAEATPREIYDTIVSAMSEDYDYHQRYAQKCKDLLDLLSGDSKFYRKNGWEMTGDGFCIPPQDEKQSKWILPVEMDSSGECYVNLPDDLLGAANLKDNDKVEWVDNKNGTYTLRKVS